MKFGVYPRVGEFRGLLDVRFFASLYWPGLGFTNFLCLGGIMRSLSGASLGCVAVLALGSFTAAGCAKVGEIQAKKAFKAANAAYQQQDYKKASDLYEQTIAAAPDSPTANQAYFFLGNSYDNQYKPSKKGDPANDALLTKA